MRGILADNDVEGFVKVMLAIWLSEPCDIWEELNVELRAAERAAVALLERLVSIDDFRGGRQDLRALNSHGPAHH